MTSGQKQAANKGPSEQGDRRRPAQALATALVLAAGALGGCGSSGRGPESITLYSGQHEQTTQALITAFEKQTGIRVAVRYDDEDTFAYEIVEEASHPKTDVFYTENSPPLEYLQTKGLLAPVSTATLAKTPGMYDSPAGEWVGISARVSVLVYDPKLISRAQLPTHILQLGDPKFKGELALAPGETDFQPIVTSVDRAYGTARTISWLRRVNANSAGHVYADNETITNKVSKGAVAFGVINQYYWYRLRAEIGAANVASRISYFAPHDPGYVVDVSGAAILKSSRHKAAAQRFLAFLVSKQGQEIIARSQSFEYPLDDHVQPGIAETPFDQLKPYPITVAQLGDGSLALSLLQKAGLL